VDRVLPVVRTLRQTSALLWCGLLVVVYIVLLLSLPISEHSLGLYLVNLDHVQYRLLIFTLIVPFWLIWFAAFYAYNKLQEYTKLLGDEKEAPAFRNISRGVQIMAWGLAVPAILSVILRGFVVRYQSFDVPATIISNYLMLAVPLVAFTFIGTGARALSNIVKKRPGYIGMRLFALAFIVLGVSYCYLTLYDRNPNGNPYHLSTFGMISTVIIPYLYAWFLGFVGCYELVVYTKNIKGLLYKRALSFVTAGVGIVVVSSIFIQYLTVVYASEVITLSYALLVLYPFLAIEALGYTLIAFGSRRLKKIEEI
jgi:hypothetical protein